MKINLLKVVFLSIVQFSVGQNNYEIITVEGYYSHEWEQSFFYEKKDDSIKKPIWLEFDSSVDLSDSLSKVFNSNEPIFIKVFGKKFINGNYGHLGISKSLLVVTEIILIDPKKTLNNFLESLKK